MTKYVVDANVAVKWVLPEIHAEAASRLLSYYNKTTKKGAKGDRAAFCGKSHTQL